MNILSAHCITQDGKQVDWPLVS